MSFREFRDLADRLHPGGHERLEVSFSQLLVEGLEVLVLYMEREGRVAAGLGHRVDQEFEAEGVPEKLIGNH